jgi:hypothetical protein
VERPRSASVSCANRATTYAASTTSRWPPSGARPARDARAGKRKLVGASAYGGAARSTAKICALTRTAGSRSPNRTDPRGSCCIFPPWRNRRNPYSG